MTCVIIDSMKFSHMINKGHSNVIMSHDHLWFLDAINDFINATKAFCTTRVQCLPLPPTVTWAS